MVLNWNWDDFFLFKCSTQTQIEHYKCEFVSEVANLNQNQDYHRSGPIAILQHFKMMTDKIDESEEAGKKTYRF